ncbi:Os09g0466201, partial [Oryza sativa Japonica Group]
VVDVGEGSDGLHPPFEGAQDQQLHPLDRLRLEHVPFFPDLADGPAIEAHRFPPSWQQATSTLLLAAASSNPCHPADKVRGSGPSS